MQGTLWSRQYRTTGRSSVGLTTKRAPRAMTSRAACSSSTVPAPMTQSVTPSPASWPIAAAAPGVVSVISTAPTPPAASALAMSRNRPGVASRRRTTAMTPLARSASVTEQRLHAFLLDHGTPSRHSLAGSPAEFQRLLEPCNVSSARARQRLGRSAAALLKHGNQGQHAYLHLGVLVGRNDAPLVVEPRIAESLHDRTGELCGGFSRQVGCGDDLVEQQPPQERPEAGVFEGFPNRANPHQQRERSERRVCGVEKPELPFLIEPDVAREHHPVGRLDRQGAPQFLRMALDRPERIGLRNRDERV